MSKRASKQTGKTLTLVVPDTSDPEEIRAALERDFPEYVSLNSVEKRELLAIVLANRGRPQAIQARLVQINGSQNYTIDLGDGANQQLFLALKLMECFGTNSLDFTNARASEMIGLLGSLHKLTDGAYNGFLAYIAEMRPRDAGEAMMLTQMYATHISAMNAMRRFNSADTFQQAQAFGNFAAKFMRLANSQMETLARLRRGGEQIIKHVHVDNRGGQAVITDQITTGGLNGNSGEQPLTFCPEMFGADPFGQPLPIIAGEGETTLPNARRNVARRA